VVDSWMGKFAEFLQNSYSQALKDQLILILLKSLELV